MTSVLNFNPWISPAQTSNSYNFYIVRFSYVEFFDRPGFILSCHVLSQHLDSHSLSLILPEFAYFISFQLSRISVPTIDFQNGIDTRPQSRHPLLTQRLCLSRHRRRDGHRPDGLPSSRRQRYILPLCLLDTLPLTHLSGAKVYITGRRMEALETAAKEHSPDSDESSGSIVPIGPCDVTSKQSLEDLVKQIESKEKYLSLVVAAAGMSGPKSSPDTSDAVQMKKNLWAESPEEWNAVSYVLCHNYVLAWSEPVSQSTKARKAAIFQTRIFFPLTGLSQCSPTAQVHVTDNDIDLQHRRHCRLLHLRRLSATPPSRTQNPHLQHHRHLINVRPYAQFPSSLRLQRRQGRNGPPFENDEQGVCRDGRTSEFDRARLFSKRDDHEGKVLQSLSQ